MTLQIDGANQCGTELQLRGTGELCRLDTFSIIGVEAMNYTTGKPSGILMRFHCVAYNSVDKLVRIHPALIGAPAWGEDNWQTASCLPPDGARIVNVNNYKTLPNAAAPADRFRASKEN